MLRASGIYSIIIIPARRSVTDVLCNDPVGEFLAHGKGYEHYKVVLTATSKPRPYKSDHKPVVGWRGFLI